MISALARALASVQLPVTLISASSVKRGLLTVDTLRRRYLRSPLTFKRFEPHQNPIKICCWVGLWTVLVMKDHQTHSGMLDKNVREKNISNGTAADSPDIDSIVKEADALLEEYKFEDQYTFITRYKHIENDEVLWRMGRACSDWAKVHAEKGDSHRRKVLMEEGFSYLERALKLNDASAMCHSWYATMLHYSSESHGYKTQYMNAFILKEHYMKAIELDSSDAVSLHSMGYWCFEFAHLPWIQKKILQLLFKEPPKTTMEEALEFFYKAEEAKPGFFSMNLVMAGRAHHHLHQYDKARDLFNRALQVVPHSPDERQAHAKATEMLKKMDHHHH